MSDDARIRNIMAVYDSNEVPGAALSVIKNGDTLVRRGFGMADLENEIKVTPETNFRLASVTKQFTAMCIMMLVEDGSIDYHTPLSQIFPELPQYADGISILHLLQHTSGLTDYESLIADSVTVQVHDVDVLSLIVDLADSTYFTPGSAYQYSNSGYAILALTVERLSGESFPEFLKGKIFDVVGMTNSVAFVDGESVVSNRAYGYTIESDSVRRSDQSRTSAVLGDGGIYSSLHDLYLWDQALYTNLLVSDSTLERAFTPNKELYGFGWRIDDYKGHKRYRHSGSTQGFRNFITRFPDDSLTVILLTNRNSSPVRDLAEEIVDIYLK